MRRFSLWIPIILSAIACFYFGLRYGPISLTFLGISVSDAQKIVETLRSFIEAMAIVVAGVWTYERFIKSREDYPYPSIQHHIQHYILASNRIYLSVFVTVTNQGKAKLDLGGGKIYIRQVSPLSEEIKSYVNVALEASREKDVRLGKVEKLFIDDGQRLGWITLGYREWNKIRGKINELEPGQTREFQFDFLLLEDDVKVVEAISYIKSGDSEWELATLYSLESHSARAVSSVKS